MIDVDVAIIGGGPAGLAAALSAYRNGAERVWLLERDLELGGILPQCIHDGFGVFVFKEMLTGPEYAQRYIDEVKKTEIEVKLNTMVLEMAPRRLIAVNPEDGILDIRARAIVLAMGCRERTRSQILIPGYRPAGIYTAGVAQRYINIDGVMPGRKVVILGSGDVGLIMARRFTLEGAVVEGVYEIMPYPGGLTRNIIQCLDDYCIPLHLSHTVVDIKGKKRVEGVTVAQVDPQMRPIEGTEREVSCDTLLLSVGLIPENELSRMAGLAMDPMTGGPVVDEAMETSVLGIFACGNVVHVYDLVDDVSKAGETAGKGAAISGGIKKREVPIIVKGGRNVRYVVPQIIRNEDFDKRITFYLRVKEVEEDVKVVLLSGEKSLYKRRERVVKPPEMVRLTLLSKFLEKVGNELTIEVQR
jgi:NADPH-dependent 2,4-dienoyl-CoA reductase/sulfur reductase-like enzyme